MMKRSPYTRFCIVGAGAAGLTAAEALKNLGYQDVTVLEKAASAGGKCRSIMRGGRSYELGAGIIAANDKTVSRLAARAGVKLQQSSFGELNLYDTDTGKHCPKIFTTTEKIAFAWQLLIKYRRLCNKHSAVTAPGFANLDPDLFRPFSEWARDNGIELVKRNFERLFTGFGYGYWDKIPAVYVLKYYNWATLKSYIRRGVYSFPDGIQHLWNMIASNHYVRYGIDIKAIRRSDHVVVDLDGERLKFDVLLLAGPLDEMLKLMDSTPAETDLFTKIQHIDYRTYACRVSSFVQNTGFIPANLTPARQGHPVFWYMRYNDSDLYTMYVIGDGQMTDEQIIPNIESAVSNLGGRLHEVQSISRWKYFPHVSTEHMRNGYFDRLDAQQGKNHTFYIGELLNFSTVEMTATYAEHLVGQHF